MMKATKSDSLRSAPLEEPDGDSALTDGLQATDIVDQIELRLDQFSAQERAVALVVIKDLTTTIDFTIGQLAAAAGTSEATVTRFCRTIGTSGYPQFRLRLAAAAARRRGGVRQRFAMLSDIEHTDSTATIVEKLRHTETQALAATLDGLDLEAVTRAVEILSASRRTMTFGVGSSATAAFDAATKLGLSGRPAMMVHDVHTALMTAATMHPGEAVVAFTHSGRARDVVEVLQASHASGIDTIVVTSDPSSPAAQDASVVLVTSAREFTSRSGGIASRLVQLSVVDVLFVLLTQRRRLEAADEAERMREAVADLVVGSGRSGS